MIKSENKAFGFWFIAGTFLFFIFLTVCTILQFEFNLIIIKFSADDMHPLRSWMILHSIVLLIFGSILWLRCPLIYFNGEDFSFKTIVIKNIITRQQRQFHFKELDGYLTAKVQHVMLGSYYDVICLVREGRIIQTIDSFYYSNFSEMGRALHGLKCLGRKKSFFSKIINWLNELPGR